MKATLSFSLPDEKEEFDIIYKALETHSALSEFDNFLRRKIKYDENADVKIYEEIREEFYKYFSHLL